MTGITTHVLDTVLGKPAAGILIRLEKLDDDSWLIVAECATDEDGRCSDLAPEASAGTYRLTFETGAYLARAGRTSVYPSICISLRCDGRAHYHMPLLLSDNSYTTYRGS